MTASVAEQETGEGRLKAGDILSYSTGSTQTGPHGYRKVRDKNNLLKSLGDRWPDLIQALGVRPALFINAYPACAESFCQGITIDTYLRPQVLTRALQLGKAKNHPTILLGQPMFIADALLRHIKAELVLPKTLILWAGGYVMPQSLENMLRSTLEPHVERLMIIQFFGAAEVDAACLMARERNTLGELIYYPREDVCVELDDEDLLLSLKEREGAPASQPFQTGDQAYRCGSGLIIRNLKRLHPLIEEEMESWTHEDWERRTGYIQREDHKLFIQLREEYSPRQSNELKHFSFAQCFGFSWLNKPQWR